MFLPFTFPNSGLLLMHNGEVQQCLLLIFHNIIPPRIIFIDVTLSRKQLIIKSPPSPQKGGLFFLQISLVMLTFFNTFIS